MLLETYCVNDCPSGYRANYAATKCINEDELNLKMFYFPYLIAAAIVLFISIGGGIRKRKHRVITNFLVMLGVFEHFAFIT